MQLIRVAVDAEPDNQSSSGQPGMVRTYKRGKFEEARTFLDRAARPPRLAPIRTCDSIPHGRRSLSLWRAGTMRPKNGSGRSSAWTKSAPDRDDLRQLKVELEQKLSQQKKGQPGGRRPGGLETSRAGRRQRISERTNMAGT